MAEYQSVALETAADDGAVQMPRASSRPTCAGRISWMTTPGWEVRECVLPHGHGGDHRCRAGYPWNDGRWLD